MFFEVGHARNKIMVCNSSLLMCFRFTVVLFDLFNDLLMSSKLIEIV